jgi:hypothetical protein
MTMYSPAAEKDRRRRLIVRISIVVGLLVILVIAALLWPKPTPGGLSVATVRDAEPAGVLQGELTATRTGDHVCYAITGSDGGASVLRFVSGWSADARLDLRDASGGVVAQPGDTVVALGKPGAVGTVKGCMQRGRIWTVTSVKLRS